MLKFNINFDISHTQSIILLHDYRLRDSFYVVVEDFSCFMVRVTMLIIFDEDRTEVNCKENDYLNRSAICGIVGIVFVRQIYRSGTMGIMNFKRFETPTFT